MTYEEIEQAKAEIFPVAVLFRFKSYADVVTFIGRQGAECADINGERVAPEEFYDPARGAICAVGPDDPDAKRLLALLLERCKGSPAPLLDPR